MPRIPVVRAAGNILAGGFDPNAIVALGHAMRSLREFAITVDGVEEGAAKISAAASIERKIIATARAASNSNKFFLPENLHDPVRYWQERRLQHAKAGTIALRQVQDALEDFADLSAHLAVADQAFGAFKDAFPDLTGLRDSVAHASVRARWQATKDSNRPAVDLRVAPRADGNLYYSDMMSSVGTMDGDYFEFRILRRGKGATGRLAFNDASIGAARKVLQDLVATLPWTGNAGELRSAIGSL